jgi:hypothetical protein
MIKSQRVPLRLGSNRFAQNSSRPVQLQIFQPNLDHIIVMDLNGPILRKKRHRSRLWFPILKHFDGLAPDLTLGIVDLAEVEHLSLHDSSAAHPTVLHDVPVAVFFAVFPALTTS